MPLELHDLRQNIFRVLVNEIVCPFSASFRYHPQEPTRGALRSHIHQLLDALRILRDLLDFTDARSADRLNANHHVGEQCSSVNPFVVKKPIAVLPLKEHRVAGHVAAEGLQHPGSVLPEAAGGVSALLIKVVSSRRDFAGTLVGKYVVAVQIEEPELRRG